MIRIFKSEWRKLRRPTLFLGTMAAVIGLTGLISSLLFLLLDSPRGNAREGMMITREILAMPNGLYIGFANSAGLLGVIALCVFAAQTAIEYTNGTLRNLLVREPRRLLLLTGKYLAMISFAFITVFFSAIVSLAISVSLAGTKGVSTDQWFTSSAISLFGSTFGNVFLSVISYGTVGMTLGLLLRSPITSISIAVAWILVIENILSATVNGISKWLPGQLMSAIPVQFGVDFSYSRALAGSAAYLLIFAVAAATLFKRRDVVN
ncbi:MAG: ABC transporter permease [Candidatus Nanopelagicaceae bacterium]|nr:ABC transporter permease [Candidatus Nanopelagicaceae bacterium]